ncbi:MAG: SLC26A/SulP transporter family protein [Anaerolineales bacterium]|nr:SLC26A/SulP transporter family protein [Anaerolineales bacterium]
MASTVLTRAAASFRKEMSSISLLPVLTAGGLIGFTEAIIVISFGSLIFSGGLSPYLSQGIGLALMSGFVILTLTALFSSARGVIGSVQDSTSVLMAVITASLVGSMTVSNSANILPTVLVTIALTTLLSGLFLLGTGVFKLGELVRYIPYPVVGGFIAGTGWLLVQGSIGTMADYTLTIANIPNLLQPEQVLLWLPGVLIALVLFFGLRLIKTSLAMPVLLALLFGVFYLGLLVSGTSTEQAKDMGLLLGQVGQAQWQPFNPSLFAAADWNVIFGQAGNIAAVIAIALIGLLLNASSIELAIKKDVDFNRELRSAGIANVLSGFFGGLIGYQALSLTSLSNRVRARGRLPGIIAGLICGAVLLIGAAWLAYIPMALLGGLLLFLGLDFLYDWVIKGWSRFSRVEYAVVILILVVIATTNFLIGVGVGLLTMTAMFVVSYSRTNVFHHRLSGADIQSNVLRAPSYRRLLLEDGEQTYILELQGFLFFGTANALFEQIRARLKDGQRVPVRFIILDFRHVTGLDSSAAISFTKARQLAEEHDITLVLTGTSDEVLKRLAASDFNAERARVRIFSTLDLGLEWCEDQILQLKGFAQDPIPTTRCAQLADNGFNEELINRLLEYMEPVEIKEGEHLIHQGDPAEDMYYIETGRVSVVLESEEGQPVRLRTLSSGTTVGELGLYLGSPRTASVIADEPTLAFRLTKAALQEMNRVDTGLASAFHEMITRQLAERLAMTSLSLEALLK